MGGLGSQKTWIKEKYGVELQESVGLCMLVGTDKDYLELVVATLDQKYAQYNPANGAIVVVENGQVTWKFFGQDAVLLKNLFYEELDNFNKIKAVVRMTQPLVVEIAYEPKLHNRVKKKIYKLQNDLKNLCKEAVKVPKSESKIICAREFATHMTDKSVYIKFSVKNSELCFFGRKDETVKRTLIEWQKMSLTNADKPKHVTSIPVNDNGARMQRNEGNKLTLDGNRTIDLTKPQIKKENTVSMRTPQSAVAGSESLIPEHAVADGGTTRQYDVSNRHDVYGRPKSAQFLRHNASPKHNQQYMSQSLWTDTNIPQEQVSGSKAIIATSSNNKTTSKIKNSSVLQHQTGEKLDRSNQVTEQSSQHRNPHYSASAGIVPSTSQFSYEYQIGKMDIKVYSKSMTEITGMDAIVNAANEHMAHVEGVSYYISQAAGSSMDQECRQFVSKKGPLRVTENFVSRPGRMMCKGIIHAVGPQWWHYVDDQEECARDLYRTVMNVLDEAGKLGYRRIAMPAISAELFGVPKQLCAEMYVKAFQDFEHRKPGLIQEVHFIDIDPDILGLVINAHMDALADPNCLSFSNAKKYPSARPHHPDTGSVGGRKKRRCRRVCRVSCRCCPRNCGVQCSIECSW